MAIVGGLSCYLWLSFFKPLGEQMASQHAENRRKLETIKRLSAEEYERLIVLSADLQRHAASKEHSFVEFGPHGYKPVPPEFASFGFTWLSVSEDKVRAKLYFIVDSGAFVEIYPRNNPPTILLCDGEPETKSLLYQRRP